MLDSLKFVQGAVAKKDIMPALTHFHISGGLIKGYNGNLALCSPIDLDLDVCPKALPFAKAIETCRDTVQINMTPAGRLGIKSGKFKAYIECLEDTVFPEIEPEGESVDVDGDHLLKVLKQLEKFIGEDASRPWARGVLFRGGSAIATNNVVLIEYWLGYDFPVEVNIPHTAIKELLRIKKPPVSMQVSEGNVTFHFEGGQWLRTQTQTTQWPDIQRVLDVEGNLEPVPEGLYQGVEDLRPFADRLERIYFHTGGISTCAEGVEDGAHVEVPGLHGQGCYNASYLLTLRDTIDSIDFTAYPKPCPFRGDKVRGVIIGMRPEG